jgi:hypothetical protein
MIALEIPEVNGLPTFSSDDCEDYRCAQLSAIPLRLPFELSKNTGKTHKSSVPVLSAGPLYFLLSTLLTTLLAAQGFLHIWPIALAFLQACTCMLAHAAQIKQQL